MLQLQIDAWNNRLVVNGVAVAPRTRWLAVFLQALLDGGTRAPGLTRDELESALVGHGRTPRPLLPRQVQRLVEGLRMAFDAAGQAAAFDERFVSRPQGKTAGPWRWLAAPGDELQLVGPAVARGRAAVASAGRAAALADSPHGPATVALATLLKQVLACEWDGQPDLAIEILRDDTHWSAATPELRALRQLKLGELLAGQRDFDAAAQAFDQADLQLKRAPVAARGPIVPLLDVQRLRAHYNRLPTVHYLDILRGERQAGGVPSASRGGQDSHPVADAERLNLLALCERRWLEAQRGRATPAQWARHVDVLLRHAHGALFLCLATEQFERAQNICANLAYAHQQLARWTGELQRAPRSAASAFAPDHLRRAIEWHALSLSIHWRFDLPDNSAYEYIFLGELWLSGPVARAAFESAVLQIAWHGERPDQVGFYRKAWARAEQVGDARQMAYAALNKLGFAEVVDSRAIRLRALKLLRRVLEAHPDLGATLQAEGYVLPATGQAPA